MLLLISSTFRTVISEFDLSMLFGQILFQIGQLQIFPKLFSGFMIR